MGKDRTYWIQLLMLLLGIQAVLISTTVYLAQNPGNTADELKLKEVDFFKDQNVTIDVNGNPTVALNEYQNGVRNFYDTKINAITNNKTRLLLSDYLMVMLFFSLIFIKPVSALASNDDDYDFTRLKLVPFFWLSLTFVGMFFGSIYEFTGTSVLTAFLRDLYIAIFLIVADVLFVGFIFKLQNMATHRLNEKRRLTLKKN